MELLPLWLAPNMVTLLGFFFILFNVICLVIWMPDLVGPVRSTPLSYEVQPLMFARHIGSFMAIL